MMPMHLNLNFKLFLLFRIRFLKNIFVANSQKGRLHNFETQFHKEQDLQNILQMKRFKKDFLFQFYENIKIVE